MVERVDQQCPEGGEALHQGHALVALPRPFELVTGEVGAFQGVVDRPVDLFARRCTIGVIAANDAREFARRPVVDTYCVVIVRSENDHLAPGCLV